MKEKCVGMVRLNMADRALIDKHYISYMDYDMYWCRRWKRNRKWDGEKQLESALEEGKE